MPKRWRRANAGRAIAKDSPHRSEAGHSGLRPNPLRVGRGLKSREPEQCRAPNGRGSANLNKTARKAMPDESSRPPEQNRGGVQSREMIRTPYDMRRAISTQIVARMRTGRPD